MAGTALHPGGVRAHRHGHPGGTLAALSMACGVAALLLAGAGVGALLLGWTGRAAGLGLIALGVAAGAAALACGVAGAGRAGADTPAAAEARAGAMFGGIGLALGLVCPALLALAAAVLLLAR